MGDLNRIKVMLVERRRTAKWFVEELRKNPVTVSWWCASVSQLDQYTLNKITMSFDIDTREFITSKDRCHDRYCTNPRTRV